MCEMCAQKQAQITRLEEQVKRQNDLLKLAKAALKRQKQQLDNVRLFTWNIGIKAGAEIAKAQQGGLAKGQHTFITRYWEGVGWCAGQVFRLVQVDWAGQIIELIAALKL